MPIQRGQHGVLHACLERVRRFTCPQDVHRVLPDGALEASHVPKSLRQRGGVQRGRHQQQSQVVAQGLLHVERQRQSDIRVQAALVELVEDDQRDTGELGIVLDDPRQHPFGDDGQSGVFGHPRLAPHAQSDALSRSLAEVGGQAVGHRSGRQTTGFEQDDPADERLAQQECQGQTRALSGTGFGAQQHVPRRQGLRDVVRERHDGQVGDGVGKGVDRARSSGVPRAVVWRVRRTGCSVSSWQGVARTAGEIYEGRSRAVTLRSGSRLRRHRRVGRRGRSGLGGTAFAVAGRAVARRSAPAVPRLARPLESWGDRGRRPGLSDRAARRARSRPARSSPRGASRSATARRSSRR